MKYKFIPVDNDINKAIAFANTLDSNNIKNIDTFGRHSSYIHQYEKIKHKKKERIGRRSV